MAGYYRMERGWQDHPVFRESRFSERDAWVNLIESACYKPSVMRHKKTMLEIKRGQVPTSYRKLAEKWGWAVNTVISFLSVLEAQQMITRSIDTGFLIITLCNYDEYQLPTKSIDTQPDTQLDTDDDTHIDTQPDTNRKNINKRKYIPPISPNDFILPAWVPVEPWNALMEVRKKKRDAQTPYALNLIVRKLEALIAKGHDPTTLLHEAIEKSWSTVFEPKGKFNAKPDSEPKSTATLRAAHDAIAIRKAQIARQAEASGG